MLGPYVRQRAADSMSGHEAFEMGDEDVDIYMALSVEQAAMF